MSKIQLPQENLSLKLEGAKKETIVLTPEDYYLLVRNDETVPVIRHDALLRLADTNGIFIDKTVLEFGSWNSPTNFCFIHRASKTIGGKIIDEVGEANPKNLESFVSSAYPAIMSNKRAQDRLLIRLMGLAGQIYSDVEISALGCEKSTAKVVETTPRRTKPKATEQTSTVEAEAEIEQADSASADVLKETKAEPNQEVTLAPVKETVPNEPTQKDAVQGEWSLDTARAMVVDYGATYSKAPITLGELKENNPDGFAWLIANKSLSSAKMKSLRAAAVFLHEAENIA